MQNAEQWMSELIFGLVHQSHYCESLQDYKMSLKPSK